MFRTFYSGLVAWALLWFSACGPNQPSTTELPSVAKSEWLRADSLQQADLQSAMEAALQLATARRRDSAFAHRFRLQVADGLPRVETSLQIGPLFAAQQRHLVVRRCTPAELYLDVFHLRAGRWVPVLADTVGALSYLGDSIHDVNGDGRPDFLLNFYPASGCCLRSVYRVFVYQPATGDFAAAREFINPTFSPAERLVRGVAYGHPGEGPLYKFRWRGSLVDTVEYIYPDPADSTHSTFIRQPRRWEYDRANPGQVRLKALPAEYRRINDIGWFLDK